MLISGTDLTNIPILGLQTGSELAVIESEIVNPHNLSIVAFELTGQLLDNPLSLLRVEDIREFSQIGMIVDSSDEFVQPDDVIKLKPIYDLHFSLKDKQVLSEKRNKLGKVMDYIIDSDSFVIQQIVVRRPLLKSFNDSELLIHRSQVIEVTDEAIVIKEKAHSTVMPITKNGHSYINPFRQQSPQTDISHNSQD
ncbi:hypothetical protein A2707_03025 [Candidatus Saccharibacteria bacterium RIFCSPHIGHO2_01_FULL_45_15]|nr:MAG: hypothetical protein A2707_03025 [Candidatus Saccharibacteria bacterium RIFCSPHIGHO2_01_FULL_45_15]OGL27083.1 MAG: hypothetical protein A3C39_00875 [Candidatus Saccharibacteria bacterium RIFCSPHIGHO2_02_FULL_46_12]OGL32525.1 MAG: hypothetical protein A3E76_00545 [Candidatus Saccharibacteria bacterium RIFCSPHIGHO2_12_FULL_44_22]